MRMLAKGIVLAGLCSLLPTSLAFAQGTPPARPQIPDDVPDSAGQSPAAAQRAAVPSSKAEPAGQIKKNWSDIAVLPRKAVLKSGRVEVLPFVGMSVNDPLIRHYSIGGMLNYYLTDVMAVGLEGNYYLREISERSTLIGLQYDRVPTINEMKWAAALNFSYVPLYGKFGVFNQGILHWELQAIGGLGLTHTQIIPRNPSDAIFSNYNITPNLGIGARFFLGNWMSVWLSIRDYIYPDKFEAANRPAGQAANLAQDAADSKIINNVVFAVGFGFFFPTSFRYQLPR